jgi:hypothetical protein
VEESDMVIYVISPNDKGSENSPVNAALDETYVWQDVEMLKGCGKPVVIIDSRMSVSDPNACFDWGQKKDVYYVKRNWDAATAYADNVLLY